MRSAKLSQVSIVMLQPGSRSATGSGSPTAAKRKAAGAGTAASVSQGQPSGGQAGAAGVPGSPSKGGTAPDGLQGPQQQAAPAAGSADLMSLDTPDPPALQAAQVGVLLGGLAKQHLGNISARLSHIAGSNRGLHVQIYRQLNFCVAMCICLTAPATPPKTASFISKITASANMFLRLRLPPLPPHSKSHAPISSCVLLSPAGGCVACPMTPGRAAWHSLYCNSAQLCTFTLVWCPAQVCSICLLTTLCTLPHACLAVRMLFKALLH